MFRRSALGDMWRHPLASAIVLTGITIFFYAINISICGTTFLIPALLFATVWLMRFVRDQQAVAQAREQAQQPPPPSVMQPPTQTPRGSGRMFVPPPIDQDRQ